MTETGITGAPGSAGTENNLWKSLWWLEVLMHQAQTPGVSYSFYWGTHSPWSGNTEADMKGQEHGALLRLDNNKRKPTGEVVRLYNRYFYNQVLGVERVHGQVRVFASRDPDSGKLSIFLLNKASTSQPVRLNVTGAKPMDWTHLRYRGRHAHDTKRRVDRVAERRHADTLSVTCPGMSLTILHQ